MSTAHPPAGDTDDRGRPTRRDSPDAELGRPTSRESSDAGRGRPTSRDSSDAGLGRPTARDEPAGRARPTSRESAGRARPTARDDGRSGRPAPKRYSFPDALAARYSYDADLEPGSQAGVLLCTDLQTRTPVAIKLYLGEGVIDPTVIDALVDGDARHVVPSRFESGEGREWEIMEYFPLGSLHGHMAADGGRLHDEAFTRGAVAELTEAVDYIHGRDIVHRDLKPGNILVRTMDPLDLVLCDFGVSIRTAGTAAASVRGTWAYAPPEASFGEVSKAGDWWPIGVIAHELLTGRHPLADAASGLLPPDREMRVLLGQGAVRADGVGDARWRMLLEGLLTLDATHRWRAAQVRDWLAGRSPEVWRPVSVAATQPVAAKVRPFVLGDVAYTEPAALAEAMATHWAEAGQKLAGRGVEELRAFLQDTGTPPERVREIADRGRASFVVLAMQGAFLPGRAPRFQGRPLDAATLEGAARAAQDGDGAAAHWIHELRTAHVLGEAARYAASPAQLSVAEERLTRWWSDVEHWLTSIEEKGDLPQSLSQQRAMLEGVILLAAFDDDAARELRSRARQLASNDEPVADWATRLLSEARHVSAEKASDTATAAASLAVLPAARAFEHDRRDAQEHAEQERRRAEAAEVLAQRRRLRRELLGARRTRAGGEFWRRIWVILAFGVIAGWLSTVPLGTWGLPLGRPDFWAAAAWAAAPALALSIGVLLWETYVDRVRTHARTRLFLTAALTCVASWWMSLTSRLSTGMSVLPTTEPVWWVRIAVVFAMFFVVALIVAAAAPAPRPTEPAQIREDAWWARQQPPRRLGALATWSVPAVVLAGITVFGHGAALLAAADGQTPESMVAQIAPAWVHDLGVRLDGWLPDLPLGSSATTSFVIALAVFCAGFTMPALARDVARRWLPLAFVLQTAALVACLFVALASPWPFVFAATLVVFGIVGVVIIGVVLWILASLAS